MKKGRHQISIYYEVIDKRDNLEKEDLSLVNQAINASSKAYAPYSDFKVGAAILLENGNSIIGSNQENAAYPSGLCAERVAAFSAGSEYPTEKIKKIAIAARKENGAVSPVTPCGACRQVLLEYEIKQNQSIEVLLTGIDGSILVFKSINDLLPVGFNRSQLD